MLQVVTQQMHTPISQACHSAISYTCCWGLTQRLCFWLQDFIKGDDSCTASDWKDVPDGAEINWNVSKFKGQIISQDRATPEERWVLLEDKVVRAVTLLGSNAESELDIRTKFDRCVDGPFMGGQTPVVCAQLVLKGLMKTSSSVGLPLHSMILTFLPAVVLPATEEPVTWNATTSHNLLSPVRHLFTKLHSIPSREHFHIKHCLLWCAALQEGPTV
jgi:hypothetical protein